MRKNKSIGLWPAALALGLMVVDAHAFAPTNFFPPFDPAYRLPQAPEHNPFRLGVNVEYGDTHNCRDWDGHKANVLRINDANQSTIAMLELPTDDVNTPDFIHLVHQLEIASGGAWRVGGAAGGGAFDDGERGHLKLHGKFEELDVIPYASYIFPIAQLPGRLSLSVHLPIKSAEVDGISMEDLTAKDQAGPLFPAWDTAVKDLLTDDIKANNADAVTKVFGNLDLGSWKHTDIADLLFLLDWSKDFPQGKEDLKNVELHMKLGVSCPTGHKKDEDKAFSLAFGNDGAWSMPFGLGLDLDFKYHIALGAEAKFEVIFDHTKDRRLKTHPYQTEFLLLNKGRATKDYGLTWKFYLYLQAFHFYRGLSLKAAYEYVKHDSDRLTAKSDNFNSSYINSAHSLGEWYIHEFIFSLNYDFFKECNNCFIKPQFSFFYKLPVSGKKIINPQTFGGQLAINF